MKLRVQFKCSVQIISKDKNYCGSITVFHPDTNQQQTFYYLSLNPYGGADAELSICTDADMRDVFIDTTGLRTTGYNQHTGRPITNYDISSLKDVQQTGLAFVVIQIISEAIYHADIEWTDKSVISNTRTPPTSIFNHWWQQDFTDDAEKYAREFLHSFSGK